MQASWSLVQTWGWWGITCQDALTWSSWYGRHRFLSCWVKTPHHLHGSSRFEKRFQKTYTSGNRPCSTLLIHKASSFCHCLTKVYVFRTCPGRECGVSDSSTGSRDRGPRTRPRSHLMSHVCLSELWRMTAELDSGQSISWNHKCQPLAWSRTASNVNQPTRKTSFLTNNTITEKRWWGSPHSGIKHSKPVKPMQCTKC